MEDLLISFVDTDRHWSRRNEEDIVISKRTSVHLFKRDYAYVMVYVATNTCADISIETRGNRVSIETYRLDSTLAFVGHAGWYARNKAGIMPKGPKVSVDDIIARQNTAHIDNGYKCFLFKITSQDDAGDYESKIEILSDGELVSTLNIDVHISSITMPDARDYRFTLELWHHPFNVAEYYGVEPWSNEHLDIMREHQLLYKSLGGRGVICTMLDEVWGGQTYSKNEIRYPSMIKWIYSKGKWTFDYTDFDKWVDLNIEVGLDDKFICYSMMPWGNRMRYFDADKGRYVDRVVGTIFKWRYKRAWSVFLNDFIRHLDAKGIFHNTYIGFDERNNMGMILDFLDSFTNKDGHKFKVSASFNNYLGNRKCLDRIDSVSVGLDEIKAHEEEYTCIAKERAKQGKFTTLYTATEHFPNSFALSNPSESYYTIIYAASTGNQGFLRWAYDAWVQDPLQDATHWSFQAGDCFLIYPNREDKRPQLSYRLMKIDEAVRDVNKLLILGEKYKLAGEITKILAKSRKNYSYRIEYNSSWGPAIREAKWADEKSEKEIISDVKSIKSDIYKLIDQYTD